MTSVTEGLEQASTGEKVNSESGFAAALAAKGVEPDKSDPASSDTSVASGLETVEPAQARDPENGKFVSKSDTSPTNADTSTDVASTVTSDDPDVAAFLAKYGGNLEEAIKGAAHAQSLIGRRDEDREQLQKEVAELRGLVEGLKTVAAPAVVTPRLSDEDVEEQAATLIGTHGYGAAATQAANASLQGDSRVYDAILDQWLVESPIQAQRFDLDFQMWKREQQAPRPVATQPDPWVEDRKTTEGMEQTFTALKKDIGNEAYAAITTLDEAGNSPISQALEQLPDPVRALIVSDDPAERLAGTRIAADRAILLTGAAPAAPKVQDTTEAGMSDSVRRKLAGASVATAGLRPASAGAQGDEAITKEEVVAAFKRGILEAETTSVASGLTYGSK